MTRSIAGDVSTEIVKQSVRPFHIAKLEFDSGTAYLSEGPVITFNGDVYLRGALEIRDMSWDSAGVFSAKLRLPDDNGSALSLVLGNRVADTPVTIWLTYGTSASYVTPVLLISGTLSPGDIDPDGVDLDVLPTNSISEFYPQQYCSIENGFFDLPKNGTVISWNDEKYVLVND